MTTTFPKIKNLRWLSKDNPDLIQVVVMLEDKSQRNLGIPGFEPEEMESIYTLDLSKLAGVHPYYPVGSDNPSETECFVDFEGVNTFVVSVSEKDMIKAWLAYKNYTYATKNI